MAIKPASIFLFLLVSAIAGGFAVITERLAAAPHLALALIAVWSLALLSIQDDRPAVGLFGEIAVFAAGFFFMFIRSSVERPLSLGNAGILERLNQACIALAVIGLLAILLAQPRKFPRLGLFVFAWAIAYLSTDKGGPDPMLRLFIDTFGLGTESAQMAVVAVRKTLHFTFYGVLAAVAFRASRNVATAVTLTLSLACFDELRQASFGARSGSIWDVALDMVGAATVLWLLSRKSTETANPKLPVN